MAKRGWSRRQQDLFLMILSKTGNVSAAAREANVSRHQCYHQRRQDPKFRVAWDDALEEAVDELEASLRKRAIEGVEKPVFYGGRQTGSVRTYSDSLGQFLLKGRRSDVFSEGHGRKSIKPDQESQKRSPREELFDRLERMILTAEANIKKQTDTPDGAEDG